MVKLELYPDELGSLNKASVMTDGVADWTGLTVLELSFEWHTSE